MTLARSGEEQKPLASSTLPETHFFDLIVIGSGPAALAVVARILESRPAALYTEDEHQHLHWLRRVDTSQRPLLRTRRTGRGQEKAISQQSNTISKTANKDVCDCEGGILILVIDRLGAWMANWDRLFAAYQIPHLRSPMFFHPAPADIEALLAFAHRTGRTATQLAGDEQQPSKAYGSRKHARLHGNADLVEISGCVGKEISKHKHKKNRLHKSSCAHKMSTATTRSAKTPIGPAVNERDRKDYFTPSTGLFHDFVQQDVVQRYGLDNKGEEWPTVRTAFQDTEEDMEEKRITLVKGEVMKLAYGTLHVDGWDRMDGFCAHLNDGVQVGAKAAVCAIGPGATPAIPDFFLAKRKRAPQQTQTLLSGGHGWCHSSAIGLNGRSFPPRALGKRAAAGQPAALVVIGGGLTSAQICDVAIRSGVPRVILVMRGYIKVKPFDLDLEWVGRYANLEKMRFWQEDDPQRRLEVMRAARNGGSLTPRYAKLLRTYIDQGRLQIHTNCIVKDAAWTPDAMACSSNTDAGSWTIDVETHAGAKEGKSTTSIATEIGGEATGSHSVPDTDNVRETLHANYIVAATGAAPSFSEVPFLSDLAAQEQVPEYGGLPWLSEGLQYGRLPLFCTGAFSALQIGPGAFNLEGMRAAADRIAVSLQSMAIGRQNANPMTDVAEQGQSQAQSSEDDVVSRFTHFSFQHLPMEVES